VFCNGLQVTKSVHGSKELTSLYGRQELSVFMVSKILLEISSKIMLWNAAFQVAAVTEQAKLLLTFTNQTVQHEAAYNTNDY